MEEVKTQNVENVVVEEKAKLKKILEDGGKITDTTIREKDKITTIRKIEPVNGEPTSSKMVTTIDEITIESL